MARTRASDYEDKQRNILDTAAAVFAELGVERASMAEVARQGHVSKALLYHYYDSKADLIFDIVRTHLDWLDATLEAVDNLDLPGEERLRLLIHRVIENYEHADAKHKVQLDSAGSLTAEQSEEIREIERRIVRRFASILLEINPDLEGERPLLMPATMSLFGILNWVYMWFRPDGPLKRDDYAEMVTTLMLGGLRSIR